MIITGEFTYLYQLAEIQAEHNPLAPALRFGDGRIWSYCEINSAANRLAKILSQQGVQAGHRVAMYVPRSEQQVIIFLAISKLHAVYIPFAKVDPISRPVATLKSIAQACKPVQQMPFFVVTEESLRSSATNIFVHGEKILWLNPDEFMGINELSDNLNEKPPPEGTADIYIIFSSGTTATPKGIAIQNTRAFHVWAQKLINHYHDVSIVLGMLDIGFDAYLWELFKALLFGAPLYLATDEVRDSPEKLYQYICRHKISHAVILPEYLRQLLGKTQAERAERLENLQRIGLKSIDYTGKALGSDLIELFHLHQNAIQLNNGFGGTEETLGSSLKEVINRDVSIGAPIQGVDYALINPELSVEEWRAIDFKRLNEYLLISNSEDEKTILEAKNYQLIVLSPYLTRGYVGMELEATKAKNAATFFQLKINGEDRNAYFTDDKIQLTRRDDGSYAIFAKGRFSEPKINDRPVNIDDLENLVGKRMRVKFPKFFRDIRVSVTKNIRLAVYLETANEAFIQEMAAEALLVIKEEHEPLIPLSYIVFVNCLPTLLGKNMCRDFLSAYDPNNFCKVNQSNQIRSTTLYEHNNTPKFRLTFTDLIGPRYFFEKKVYDIWSDILITYYLFSLTAEFFQSISQTERVLLKELPAFIRTATKLFYVNRLGKLERIAMTEEQISQFDQQLYVAQMPVNQPRGLAKHELTSIITLTNFTPIPFDIDETFDHLHGDSLTRTMMYQAIEDILGFRQTVFFKKILLSSRSTGKESVRQIAQHLLLLTVYLCSFSRYTRQSSEDNKQIKIERMGRKNHMVEQSSAIFFMPALLGGAREYQDALLPLKISAYLLRHPGLDNNFHLGNDKELLKDATQDFTLMAKICAEHFFSDWQNLDLAQESLYVAAVIKQIQPIGCRDLFGWSFGGLFVIELARQFQLADEQIHYMHLVDSAPPGYLAKQLAEKKYHYFEKLEGHLRRLAEKEYGITDASTMIVPKNLYKKLGCSAQSLDQCYADLRNDFFNVFLLKDGINEKFKNLVRVCRSNIDLTYHYPPEYLREGFTNKIDQVRVYVPSKAPSHNEDTHRLWQNYINLEWSNVTIIPNTDHLDIINNSQFAKTFKENFDPLKIDQTLPRLPRNYWALTGVYEELSRLDATKKAIVLTGAPGCGKTTCAIDYAHRFLESLEKKSQHRVVYYISLGSDDKITDDDGQLVFDVAYLALAQELNQLDGSEQWIKSKIENESERQKLLIHIRKKLENICNVLIIYDNVKNIQTFQAYHDCLYDQLPGGYNNKIVFPWASGKILITTRAQALKPFEIYHVDVTNRLTPNNVCQILSDITHYDDPQGALAIVEKLNPLVLDTVLIGRYILAKANEKISYAQYIELAERRSWEEFEIAIAEQTRTRSKVLGITFDAVKELVKKTIERYPSIPIDFNLFKSFSLFLACLYAGKANKEIMKLFFHYYTQIKFTPIVIAKLVENFVVWLQQYSLLIDVDQLAENYYMHPSIQEYIRVHYDDISDVTMSSAARVLSGQLHTNEFYQSVEHELIIRPEATANPFVALFDGCLSEPYHLLFDTKYCLSVMHALLHRVNNQLQCVRMVFQPNISFNLQLKQLILLADKLNKPAVFISIVSSGASTHFIGGFIHHNALLLIDPLGLNLVSTYLTTFTNLLEVQLLKKVWLSNTILQWRVHEQQNFVSCGPIILELMLHIVGHFTLAQFEGFWQQLPENNLQFDRVTQLSFFTITIQQLLPASLRHLERFNESIIRTISHEEQVNICKQYHETWDKLLDTIMQFRKLIDYHCQRDSNFVLLAKYHQVFLSYKDLIYHIRMKHRYDLARLSQKHIGEIVTSNSSVAEELVARLVPIQIFFNELIQREAMAIDLDDSGQYDLIKKILDKPEDMPFVEKMIPLVVKRVLGDGRLRDITNESQASGGYAQILHAAERSRSFKLRYAKQLSAQMSQYYSVLLNGNNILRLAALNPSLKTDYQHKLILSWVVIKAKINIEFFPCVLLGISWKNFLFDPIYLNSLRDFVQHSWNTLFPSFSIMFFEKYFKYCIKWDHQHPNNIIINFLFAMAFPLLFSRTGDVKKYGVVGKFVVGLYGMLLFAYRCIRIATALTVFMFTDTLLLESLISVIKTLFFNAPWPGVFLRFYMWTFRSVFIGRVLVAGILAQAIRLFTGEYENHSIFDALYGDYYDKTFILSLIICILFVEGIENRNKRTFHVSLSTLSNIIIPFCAREQTTNLPINEMISVAQFDIRKEGVQFRLRVDKEANDPTANNTIQITNSNTYFSFFNIFFNFIICFSFIYFIAATIDKGMITLFGAAAGKPISSLVSTCAFIIFILENIASVTQACWQGIFSAYPFLGPAEQGHASFIWPQYIENLLAGRDAPQEVLAARVSEAGNIGSFEQPLGEVVDPEVGGLRNQNVSL